MRLFLRNLLWITAIALVMGGFTACSDDETVHQTNPTLTAEGKGTSWSTAEVTVTANDIVQYAWLVLPSSEAAPDAMVILKDGTKVTSPAATSTIKVTGLSVLSDYTLYLAAYVVPSNNQMQEELYDEVLAVPFKTTDYSEEFTVIKTTSDGFEAHLKYPDLGNGKVIKWGLSNIATYNMNVQQGMMFGNAFSDASAVNNNDQAYPASIVRGDTTFVVNNDNRFVRDANGEILYDEWSGVANEYWLFVAPNEPLYMMMSEASWGESDYGWGEGWYSLPFDSYGMSEALMAYLWGETTELPNQDDYWTEGAWHRRYEITTDAPKPYAGKVSLEAAELTTKGGVINVTPDPENTPFMYLLAIMDETMYQQAVDSFLAGKAEHMQWFVTSFVAMYSISPMTMLGSYGPVQIALEEFFYDLTPGGVYRAVVVAMDGEMQFDEMYGEEVPVADPMAQSYTELTFTLPDFKLDAPVIEVTPVEPTSAWKAAVNVKCTNYTTSPVVEACYAANAPSEWDMYLEYGSTYTDLIGQNRGYMEISGDDLAAINSEEGLTLEFNTRENEQLRVGVMGWNTEGRPSNPDAEGSKAVADTHSGIVPDATPIESPYYESLVGEWTATATVRVNKYNEDTWSMEWVDGGQVTTNVTIGDCYVPESMTDEVYQIYEEAGVSKEMADVYFAEYKEEAALYSKKVRGQNRILCTGWGFDKHSSNPEYSDLRTKTPWDLFTDAGYNAATTADLFYDFGPKWFLQVAEDGSLFVPVNMNRVPVAGAWSNELYLVGGNAESGYAYYQPLQESDMDNVSKWPNLPVEVSEDGNTITIKAFDYDGTTYYPNMTYYSSWSGMAFFYTAVVSDVVLTRNTTTATANTKSASVAAPSQLGKHVVKALNVDGSIVKKTEKKNTVTLSKTPLKAKAKVEYKKIDAKALTPAQREANLKQLYEKMQKGARK